MGCGAAGANLAASELVYWYSITRYRSLRSGCAVPVRLAWFCASSEICSAVVDISFTAVNTWDPVGVRLLTETLYLERCNKKPQRVVVTWYFLCLRISRPADVINGSKDQDDGDDGRLCGVFLCTCCFGLALLVMQIWALVIIGLNEIMVDGCFAKSWSC